MSEPLPADFPLPHLFAEQQWPAPARRVRPEDLLRSPRSVGATLDPAPGESLVDLMERAADPSDSAELCRLYLGRVEANLPGPAVLRPDLARSWQEARRRRTIDRSELLASRAVVGFVKEMFNIYFRDDLYGALDRDGAILLSQGAVDEETWGLPSTIKACIQHALDRDWYGYSDSRGRVAAREAVARYESVRLPSAAYEADNVALTMGGTAAIATIADFLLTASSGTAPALCAIPNYPPLVAAIARRGETRLVPTPTSGGRTHLTQLREALRPDTPLVLLQTATNPTGSLVDENELEQLIEAASASTMIVLDECHEWLGEDVPLSPARGRANVIRVSSLSKNWSAPGLKMGWFVADRAFVDAFYEYASTNYGGPPSFLYTAVEVLARFERWRQLGVQRPGAAELAEFEPHYGLRAPGLAEAYHSYRADRDVRERELLSLRDHAVARLDSPSMDVISARYSINVSVDLPAFDDSYLLFRHLYHAERVSMFPGLLTFCLSGAVCRVTTARPPAELTVAIERIRRHAERHR